jgi:hypothetical protein
MSIDKVNGVLWSSIVKVTGVVKANIAKVGGASVVGGADISFDDITLSSAVQTISPSTAFTMTLPTTAVSGDWVLALFTIDDPTVGLTANPSGWTLINTSTWGDSTSDAHIKLWYREFDGSEGSSVPIYSTVSSTRGIVAWTMVVSNIDTANPISAVGNPSISIGTVVTAPSVLVPDDGTFICINAFDGSDGEPFTYDNSSFAFTDGGEDDVSTGGSGVSSAWKYATITGGTNTDTTLITAQVSDGKVAGHFALKKL